MASDLYCTDLPSLVKSGRVPEAVVDSAVLHVLRIKEALGLFRDPYRYADTAREKAALLTPEHRAAARQLAREAIVLLTNHAVSGTPALPLRSDLRSIAVIGPLATDAHSAIGPWGGAGRDSETVTPLAGVHEAYPRARVTYVRGAPVDSITTAGFAAAERAARDADAVVLVLGETEAMSGEASVRANIGLPGAQLELAQAVVRAAHAAHRSAPVIAVLMNGRPLTVPWLADSADALVESWFLGTEHGHALADVLTGAYNPSGRLPVTVPRAVGQIPIHYDHTSTGRPPADTDKYTSKYLDLPWTPLFAFGYGLSYTTFAYGTPRLSAMTVRNGDSVVVTAEVRNTGKRAGDDVVQLYVRDDAGSVVRPVRMLRGFARVTLQPGESRTLTFTLHPRDLALYDLQMRHVVEPGTFTVWVGGSSLATAEARFTVTGDTLVLDPAPPRMR
jgi:beta-glucosidase